VKFRPHAEIPKHLQALYEAKFSRDELSSREVFTGVECDDGLVLLQRKGDAIWVVHDGMEVATGFWGYPVCLVVEKCKVFVAGDHRVECFDLNSLTLFAVLSTDDEKIVSEASLTIWYDWIVLGFGQSLLFWLMPTMDGDLTKQVRPLPTMCKPELPKITSICSSGDCLAIASFDYPVVHIYRLENGVPTLWSRLISHTGGITALRSTPDSRLFTGSADATIQLWSVQDGVLELQCDRHGGPVTVIAFTVMQGGTFLFTGGHDSMVRAWDCSRKNGMWQLSVGEEMMPIALHFDAREQKLMVLSRSTENFLSTQLNTYTFEDERT
jgi:WD40 repeat protein